MTASTGKSAGASLKFTLSHPRLIRKGVHVYMNDGNEVIAQISTFSRKINYYPQYTAKMKFKGIIDLEVGATHILKIREKDLKFNLKKLIIVLTNKKYLIFCGKIIPYGWICIFKMLKNY